MENYLEEELYNLVKKDHRIFEFLQNGSLDGLWYWDLENPENEWMSPSFWKTLGYDPEQMPHKASAWQNIINPKDLQVALENVKKHVANPDHPYDQEVRYTHKKGHTVWIRCRGIVIRDENGKPIRVLGAHLDITGFKEAEASLEKEKEALRKSETKFKALFDQSGGYCMILDPNTKDGIPIILDANQAALDNHGYTREEFIGRPIAIVDDEKGKALVREHTRLIMEKGQLQIENTHQRKDGSQFEVSVNAQRIDFEDEPSLIFTTEYDITDKKRAEEELIRQRDMFETVINSVPDRIFWKDLNSNYLGCNTKFAKESGIESVDNIVGKTDHELVWADEAEKFIADDLEVIQTRKAKLHYEEEYVNQDGSIEHWRTSKIPLVNSDDDCIGILATSENITEQKRSTETVDTFFDMPLNLLLIASTSGELKRTNTAWKEILGYDEHELVNMNFLELVHPDDLESTQNEMKALEEGQTTFYFENRYRHKNGNYVMLAWSAKATLHNKLIHAVAHDITERKQAQTKLEQQNERYEKLNEELRKTNRELYQAVQQTQESNERFNKAMIATSDGLFDWDLITNEVYYSPGWKSMLGYSYDEIANDFSEWERLTDDEDVQKIKAKLETVFAGKEERIELEFKMQHKLGHWIDILARLNVFRTTDGIPQRVVGTHTDITEKKEIEQKILKQNEEYEKLNKELSRAVKKTKESNQRFNLAMVANSDGLFDWNLKTNEIYFSPSWKSMLGYEYDELPNDFSVWEKLTDPEDVKTSWSILNRLINGEIDKFVLEFRMRHKAGHWVDILSRANVFRNEDDEAYRVVGTHTDITEKKQIEQRILKQNDEYEKLNNELSRANDELVVAKQTAEESNKLKTEFLHNMSHEIRTPMNGIMGFSEFLCNPDTTAEQRNHYASIVQNCSSQLLRIIDDILEISTLETKQITVLQEEVCINDFLLNLFSIYDLKSKERKIPLYMNRPLGHTESTIISDQSKLNKILSNLLDNAFKFTSQGKIEFGYYLKDQWIVLYVKDTGIGISKDNMNRIFHRFSQENMDISRQFGGLGLGLSISKENAKLLGGDICLESKKGEGSTFFVSIPYHQPDGRPLSIPDTSADNSVPRSNSSQKCVLIVEDEEVNYLYLETLLNKVIETDLKILHAIDGQFAVEECDKRDDIALILMDIKMPRLNGHDATKIIKSKKPNIPIVAQTAYSTEADRELALNHGCDDFISKPIKANQLEMLLNKFVN